MRSAWTFPGISATPETTVDRVLTISQQLVWPLVWLKRLFPPLEECTVVSHATTSKGDDNVHQAGRIGTSLWTIHAAGASTDHVDCGAAVMLAGAIPAQGTGCQPSGQRGL